MPLIEVNCDECGAKLSRYTSVEKNHFCDRKCKAKYQSRPLEERFGEEKALEIRKNASLKSSGENNANFGKRWTDEQRKVNGLKRSKLYEEDVDLRFKVGSANRGKKFSKAIRDKMSASKLGISGTPHTEESKKKIGKKSKEKFTTEYRLKVRGTMEAKGYWIPLSEKTDYKIYFGLSNWICRMWDLVEDINQLVRLKEYGIFNPRSNIKGLVRDHQYSRKSGCENGVFPEILRHPVNCKLISTSENVAKSSCRIAKDTLTKEELFNGILEYDRFWIEQSRCVELINEYKKGNRYDKSKYIS